MRRSPKNSSRQTEKNIWKSKPGEPPIKSSGDLLAMMVQGGNALEEDGDERRAEERAAEPPPRKAIVSVRGKDVEEIEVPDPKRRAA